MNSSVTALDLAKVAGPPYGDITNHVSHEGSSQYDGYDWFFDQNPFGIDTFTKRNFEDIFEKLHANNKLSERRKFKTESPIRELITSHKPRRSKVSPIKARQKIKILQQRLKKIDALIDKESEVEKFSNKDSIDRIDHYPSNAYNKDPFQSLKDATGLKDVSNDDLMKEVSNGVRALFILLFAFSFFSGSTTVTTVVTAIYVAFEVLVGLKRLTKPPPKYEVYYPSARSLDSIMDQNTYMYFQNSPAKRKWSIVKNKFIDLTKDL